MKIKISGHVAHKPIDLTLDVDHDGKEVAKFLGDFMVALPAQLDRISDSSSILATAMNRFDKACKAITKKFGGAA